MILKDYFTDGLVQVAIVLSLLRSSDIESYFSATHVRSSIRRLPRMQETHLGPLSGYTSTDLIIRDRSTLLPSKSIDVEAYRLSVLRDLHSLSDYRRLDGVATDIHTWLVSDAAGTARAVQADRPLPPVQNGHHGNGSVISSAGGSSELEATGTGAGMNVGANSDSDSMESELSKEVAGVVCHTNRLQ